MAQRTDTIPITGEAELLDAYYLKVAKYLGWKETVKDAEGNDIPNPKTHKEVLVDATKKYWRDLGIAAETAELEIQRAQIIDAASAALDEITVTLTTGE